MGVTPALVSASYVGSARMFVSVSRSGAGIDTSDGGISDSIPGIGTGSDFRSFMSESSEGTLPGKSVAMS